MTIQYQKKFLSLLIVSFLFGCAPLTETSKEIEEAQKTQIDTIDLIETIASSSDKKPIDKVTLKDAADLVILNHPKIKQQASIIKGEEEMINIAKAGYYPQVKGGISFGYDDNRSGGDRGNQVKSLDLEIQQTIYDFGKTSYSVTSAEHGVHSAKTSTRMTEEELVHLATSSVVNSTRREQLIVLAKKQVKEVSNLLKLIEGREAQGASNLSDVLHVRARLDEVESEELDAIAQYQSELSNLRYLIGAPTLSGTKVEALSVDFDNVCSMPIDWDYVPAYILADIEAKQAQVDFELSKSEEKPTIYLSGVASHDFNKNKAPRYNSRMDSRISLNVSVPIYQGGELSAKKRAAKSWMEASDARREDVRLDINKAISDVNINLQKMQARQDLLLRRVENLNGTRELYKKQYLDLGTRSLVDLLNSEQEYHRAQVAVENNKMDIMQAKLSCALYQGKLTEYFNIAP